MTIYLDCLLPNSSSDYGERDGQPLNAPISILLRVGFTGTRRVTVPPVGSYPTFPSLPRGRGAVYFCCTFLKVAFTGRYPAPLSCGARTFLTAIFHAARSLGLLDNILLFLPCFFRTAIGVFTVFIPHGDRSFHRVFSARRSGAFRCRYRDMPRGGGLSHTFLLQRRRPQFSHSMTLSSV